MVLQHSKVQTFIIEIVANKLSKSLGTDVHIKRFHYQAFNQFTIDSLYISDQQRDTLVFIERAYISINLLQLADDRLDIKQIDLTRPYVNLQSINDSTLNCQFIINKLQRSDTIITPRINVDEMLMSGLRFRYNDLLINQLNLSLALPLLSNDSIDVQIHHLALNAQLDRLDATLNAHFRGNLDSIYADKILLKYQDKQIFTGDVAVFHPTKLDSLYIKAQCQDLYCNSSLLKSFLSQLQNRHIRLPQSITSLGNIHYHGAIDGRLEHLDLHGDFNTALGAMSVNGYVEIDTTLHFFDFCGHLSTDSFYLGKMLHNDKVGSIAFHAHVDGKIDSTSLTFCTAEADIQKIEYLGYVYQNIRFDGTLGEEEINGNLHINDENIQLSIKGVANWSELNTRLNLTAQISDFHPNAVHLTNKYPDLVISANTNIQLFTFGKKSQILDNLTGHLIIDTLHLRNGEKQATMNLLKLDINNELLHDKPHHQMMLQSDYLTANISGDFQYTTLPNTFKLLLSNYVPSLVQAPKKRNKRPNNIDFYAYFRNLQTISDVMEWDFSFPSYPTIKGLIHEQDQQIRLQAHLPAIQTSGTRIEDLTISLNNADNHLELAMYMYNHLPKENPTASKIGDVKTRMNINAWQDTIDFSIHLDNTDSVRNKGTIHVTSIIRRENNQPSFYTHLKPTNIILNDSAWSIKESTITYHPTSKILNIQDFLLSTDYQSLAINGKASTCTEDSIKLKLHNIDVQYLLSYTLAGESISVQGPLSGWATLYGLFTQPMIEADLAIPQAGLNGTYLGDVAAKAYLDRESQTIMINGEAVDSTNHSVAKVTGKIIPASKWWGLDIQCDSVDIGLIDFWTHTFFSNPQGRAFGDVHISGQEYKTWVTATLLGKNAQITIPQLGSTFYFSDSVFLDSTSIRLPHIQVYDSEGNRGVFDGTITHTYFRDFHYNLNVNVDNILAMNLPYEPQALFYGKVYGSGNVNIKGNDYECHIGVNARTEANSIFYLSVNTASLAANTSFIQFKKNDTHSNTLLHLLNQPTTEKTTTSSTQSKLLLSLQIEVTPTADINILLGRDDGIRGKGEGNVQLTYDDSTNDIQLLGTYTLQSGVFSYSIGNIVRRNFNIAEGSRVIWNGDPLAPNMDITGRYHTTASLRDLFGSDFSQVATNRSSVPVNCVLHMTDQLFNPILKFAIELPQSDESIQSQINSVINTEEMLMRQVIYLLVFNRFYPADYLKNAQAVGINETYSLLSSTITGQINSWLSKLTDVVTMGFNFRTDGEGETASQEYEANFHIQPIRQLIINGNFGYRYNDLSNRPFFGDLDIEYLLTPNGKLRAKAYTHTVDKYSLRQANTVQGLGLVFKHDFNWKTKKKKEKNKEKNKQ